MTKTPIYCPHCQRLVATVEMATPSTIDAEINRTWPDIRLMPVDKMVCSVRVANALRQANVATIGELTEITEAQLRRIPNLGSVSIKEIKSTLADLGLCLAAVSTRDVNVRPRGTSLADDFIASVAEFVRASADK
jgi:DNA-directed RNA polymerase subunit alpha